MVPQLRLPPVHSVERSRKPPVFEINKLINMYVKRGSMVDARNVFDNMVIQDVVSWNIMILGYAKQDNGTEALALYARMCQEGVQATDRTFVGALKACGSLAALDGVKQDDEMSVRPGVLEKGRAIHSLIAKSGFECDVFVGNTLVNMYTKCGSLEDAWRVFQELPCPDVVSWNAMILGYAKQQEGVCALELYAQLHQEDVAPDDRTFVGTLKACSSLVAQEEVKQVDGKFKKMGCLEKSRVIHSHVVKNGFESHVYVGNTLVDVYTKCGSMEDAECIFVRLPFRDVVSWSALILGYIKQEEGAQALEWYSQMCHEGVRPNERTFVSALKACTSLTALHEGNRVLMKECLEKAKAIHSQVVKFGLESDVVMKNTFVDMYTKCGSMEDALCLFKELSHPDVFTWTTMILGYAKQEQGAVALDLYAQMLEGGVTPDSRAFVGILKACSSLAAVENGKQGNGTLEKTGYLEQGRAIHSEVAKRGFESDIYVATTLVDMYAKFGSMEDARSIFDEVPHCNVVSWNVMILGYANQEKGALALELYTQMQQDGTPNDRTFVGALKACSSLAGLEDVKQATGKCRKIGCLEKGRAIHFQIVKSGLELDIYVGNTLLDMYVKCGSIEDARCVFEEMSFRNVVAWTTVILGYARQEEGALALDLYVQMHLENVQPNDRTFIGALKACSTFTALQEGQQIYWTSVRAGCLEKGRAIHSQVVRSNFGSDVFLATALVEMYAKCRSLKDARCIFDESCHRDVVIWNAMILGYAEHEDSEEALRLYAQMQEHAISPDSFTFVAVLKAFDETAACDIVKELHSHINRVGVASSSIVATSLIDIYAKFGSMGDAQELFDALPTRDAVPWNALIAGYAHQGESEVVFHLLEEMRQENIQPDGITFLSIFTVCSHVGLVDKGLTCFHAMSTQDGIMLTVEHYNCMVDLLGRAGQVEEAVEIVEEMPFQPTVAIWLTILGACQKWKNVEVGKHAFESVIILAETLPTAYVIMANIYSDAHMHKDCDNIIQVMTKDAQA